MSININPRKIDKSLFGKCETLKEKIEFILNYGVLAPSTHNSQPWLFKVVSDKCLIYANTNLTIPYADPTTRDLNISIGCCLENIIIAAKYFNIFKSVKLLPDDNNELIAEVEFSNSSGIPNLDYEELLNTIPKRINARGFFRKEKIDEFLISKLLNILEHENYLDGLSLHFIKNENDIARIATLTSNGLRHAYKNPAFRREMSTWINHSLSKRKQGIHGYALKMPLLLSFILPTLIKYKDIGAILAKKNYDSLKSSSMITLVTAPRDNKLVWLKTGQLVERLMLEVNSMGYNTSIFVASIEMGDLYKEVQKILKTEEIPQFMFVTGRIDSLHKFTPRHKVKDKIIK